MRTVVASKEIGHLWAHQTQERARAGNISFSGPDYYSYSTVVATIAKSKNNRRAYLLTHHSYSNSTSKHQGIARHAIPTNAKIFYVPVRSTYSYNSYPEVSGDHKGNLSVWTKQIERDVKEAKDSREPKRSRLVTEILATIDSAKKYASFFGEKWKAPELPWRKQDVALFVQYQQEREVATRQKREARWEQERIERDARDQKQKEESAAHYESWLNGAHVDIWKFSQYHPTSLRVIGDKVETSHGVDFPVDHARRGLKLVDKVVAEGKPWKSNGHTCKVGYYQIDSIDTNGTVRAGCHVVTIEAINRIRPALEGS